MQQLFEFSPEIIIAKEHLKPILALESTLITHGLPHPYNLDIAKEVHEIAREQGVAPATIAIMNGKIKIGLTDDELEELVATENKVKATTRDIPYLLNQQITGGTTIAATLFCAARAGIKVFATGGMGGVHHGDSMDISADLIELSRSPLALVCSGAKSILDLPRTVEYLETHGIPVIGYNTNTLPAFYTATSDLKLTHRINSVAEMAGLLKTHWELQMHSGVLIANPIPKVDEIPADEINPVIQAALADANKNKITGKDITPYLLNKVLEVTKGKSLHANLSLIKNNVKVGAELAAALG